jgi:SAM-dependent methyltransferase
MSGVENFSPSHFARQDEMPDEIFYSEARLVTHIDEDACQALQDVYRLHMAPGMKVLDLMSSCVSHLPDDPKPGRVTGHGMNLQELKANPQLDIYFIQNLNKSPGLSFEVAEFDLCLIAVSVQYLTDPVTVFSEIARILKPGGRLIVSFSNRMFPTKAVAIWQALDDQGRCSLVREYMMRTGGFTEISITEISPNPGHTDPLFAVVGNTG